MQHTAFGSLHGDELCHAHFVASFTHPTVDRAPSATQQPRPQPFELIEIVAGQLTTVLAGLAILGHPIPSVPSLTPRPRPTCAISFPVSGTIRAAPSPEPPVVLLPLLSHCHSVWR